MGALRCAIMMGVFCAACASQSWGNSEQIRALLEESGRLNQDGHPAAAESVARHAISQAEAYAARPGQGPGLLASAQQRLGVSLRLQGRHAEAEAVLRDALRGAERALGYGSRLAIKTQMQLGQSILSQGRYKDADKELREAVARAPEPRDADTLDIWLEVRSRLARLMVVTGDYTQAESLLRQVVEKSGGAGERNILRWRQRAAMSLALLRHRQGRDEEALRHAHEAAELAVGVWGEDHQGSADAYADLGQMLMKLGRDEEAEPWLRKAVAIIAARQGEEYGSGAKPFMHLGRLLARRGDPAAEALFSQALSIAERTASAELLTQVLRADANFLRDQGHPDLAQPLFDRAIVQADRLFALSRGLDAEARENKVAFLRPIYGEAVKNRIALDAKHPGRGHAEAALADVSCTQSRLFTELMRAADVARLARDDRFQKLRASRDDLLNRLAEQRRRFALAAKSAPDDAEPVPAKPIDDPLVLARWRQDALAMKEGIARLERQREETEAGLWREFPRFMELDEPRPVTVAELRERWLRPDETLLAYFRLKNRLLVFLVSKEEFRLVKVPVDLAQVDDLVAQARAPMESGGRVDLLARLDPRVLNRLYGLLLKPVEDRLPAGCRLLVVGDGPLYTLPMEMLVRSWDARDQARFAAARKPDLSEYALLDYAGAHWRFTYVPSLASLAIQRSDPRPGLGAKGEFIAFADPVFQRADAAPGAATRSLLEGLGAMRGGRVSIPRLPETADEVEAVAKLLGGRHEIFLRDQAQESRVKHMDLGQARYLHFATHGLLGGEFARLKDYEAEESSAPAAGGRRNLTLEDDEDAAPAPPPKGQPALVLTLVGNLADEDGLLTMSEVMGLDMNADLVVLSACNTAGERVESRGGEGFAGLTRAFMHAGARGLLVSHWSVESLATRDLVTDAFGRVKAGAAPDQALAAAQADLRASRDARLGLARAHPFFWAPFVYVGD